MVDKETIENFLNGKDDQKYIVNIQAPSYENKAYLVIRHPEQGKKIVKDDYKPFVWFDPTIIKEKVLGPEDSPDYRSNRLELNRKAKNRGITFKQLKTKDDETGFEPERVKNGYTQIAHCNVSWNNLIKFFKDDLGINLFEEPYQKYFIRVKPVEQYMIQTGKRLFKGFEDYSEIKRFYFDLETEGFDPSKNRIFQIGIRDNFGFDGNGYEEIIEVTGNTDKELRESEKSALKRFFQLIDALRPDMIAGYNSENFDWPFIEGRCEYLRLDIDSIVKPYTMNNIKKKFKRNPNVLKLGNETESYEQTFIEGYNILDTSHATRKAKAINSDIKKWDLKYITQYSNANKPNRVYVKGDKIFDVWGDEENEYALNEEDGDWYVLNENKPLKEGYNKVSGKYIIERYLKDDLWETQKVDELFSQATFLVGKTVPTHYMRNCTMGTSGAWKLLMLAWSYENNLAVPQHEDKKDFPGGLSRVLSVGRNENIVKLDFSALYPRTELTHDIFPYLDISNVMKGMLMYIVNTRDQFKSLKGKYGKEVDKIEEQIESEENESKKEELKKDKEENKKWEDFYDKKQLPLKILANSFFGSYGAPHLFPWGETICAGETTCRGRQYLRLMGKFFTDKGYKMLIMDTDGANFSAPDNVNEHTYIPEGNHLETELHAGEELTGIEADVAEFNEKHMDGYMALDIDEVADAEINFSRKNYVTLDDDKIKKTGNTLKSDILETYIAEFFDEGLKLLLENKGMEFVNKYYQLVEDLYNYRVPISKIASKNKVKMTREQYKQYCKEYKKDGSPNSRQAWMELVEYHDLDVDLGDVIYYYNVGTAKSHADTYKKKNKETGEEEVHLNCKLISNNLIENYPDTTVTDYNVPKYVDKLNKRIKALLVCFKPEVRNKLLINVKKDRKTKKFILEEKKEFTQKECELINGAPLKDTGQDDFYEDFLKMEDKEIDFWINKIQKQPNKMTEEEWEEVKREYFDRMEREFNKEKDTFETIVQELEMDELEDAETNKHLPKKLTTSFELKNGEVISKNHGHKIADFNDVFKYKNEARKRAKQYNVDKDSGKKYQDWKVNELNKKLDGHNLTDNVFSEDDIQSYIQMREDNTSLIKQGLKTATSRTYRLKDGLHKIKNEGTVLDLKGKYFDHISELKSPEKWAKAEGYDSLEDMRTNYKFNHVKDFIDGNRGLYIYHIKDVYPS